MKGTKTNAQTKEKVMYWTCLHALTLFHFLCLVLSCFLFLWTLPVNLLPPFFFSGSARPPKIEIPRISEAIIASHKAHELCI